MLISLVLLALLASAQGRAVNISNTWVLPEEGFPVFYRYFRDRISWYEADAVCQFHHANLVTVDTTAQYDAVRAYLKELDISSAVWVGLIRSNPDGDFTWTDYRGLSGDGYWSSAPDMRSAPLCAAANPAADYRWEARACGGPTVASFICELPVPQWALGNEGCMVKELPALTILYLPESAAVQLNADCGFAGVKRVQCTGNVKREGLLKDLTCADEEEISSTSIVTSIGTNWPVTTDPTAEQDTTTDVTTEENTSTEHEIDINQPILITATSLPEYIILKSQKQFPEKHTDMDQFDSVSFNNDVNLERSDDHNIESNFIPKHFDKGNVLTNEQLQKIEDERHMQHKMIHEEIARVGNVDNIFTQPTDHFIPPLVMAKSRMSDDMTVLSLAEKHAQQLAEKQFSRYSQNDNIYGEKMNNKFLSDNKLIDPHVINNPNKAMEAKKDLKSHVPKKYISEKYYESKGKPAKAWESKTTEIDKPKETTVSPTTNPDTSTTTLHHPHDQDIKKDNDFTMDLTVMLKDAPFTNEEQVMHSNYAGDVAKLDTVSNKTRIIINQTNDHSASAANVSDTPNMINVENGTMEHEVIQITVISNDNPGVNTTVFEITTKMPIFRDDTDKVYTHATAYPATISKGNQYTEEIHVVTSESTSESNTTIHETSNVIAVNVSSITVTENPLTVNTTDLNFSTTFQDQHNNYNNTIFHSLENKTEFFEIPTTMSTTAFFSDEVTTGATDLNANDSSTEYSTITDSNTVKPQDFNNTEIHNEFEKNMNNTDLIVDADSPLLSGAYEPIHRPARTRTPQQQNRKFNPFRILG